MHGRHLDSFRGIRFKGDAASREYAEYSLVILESEHVHL